MLPYSNDYHEDEDKKLILLAFDGSTDALAKLIARHQQFIYNVALKMSGDTDDAADLTQEVLIKMVTKLNQFQIKSNFRTWLYRMVMNHFLNSKRKKTESSMVSFEEYGVMIDELYDDEAMSDEEQVKYGKEVTFVRNKCMASTLLCLDRQQRIIFILGSIFNLKSNVAAEILDINPENFRKQLSRAKADLFQFMDNKCGLINPNNPCRCHKKTKGFIKDGLVSPQTGKFLEEVTMSIAAIVDDKNRALDYLMEKKYVHLFSDQPFANPQSKEQMSHAILSDPLVKELFQIA